MPYIYYELTFSNLIEFATWHEETANPKVQINVGIQKRSNRHEQAGSMRLSNDLSGTNSLFAVETIEPSILLGSHQKCTPITPKLGCEYAGSYCESNILEIKLDSLALNDLSNVNFTFSSTNHLRFASQFGYDECALLKISSKVK